MSISCFMATRNCLIQGYPVLEAIQTALPICDEFVIVDGYSSDRTYEAIKSIPDNRITLFQDKWVETGKSAEPIRKAINKAREKVSGDYIFQVDANQIIPDESAQVIKDLPRVFPEVTLFALPFYQLMGKYVIDEEYRVKLARNEKSVISIADGWTLGTALKSRKELRRLFSTHTLLSVLSALTGNVPLFKQSSTYLRYVYLPKPIFRYYSIEPQLFFNKLKERKKILSGDWEKVGISSKRVSEMLSVYEETGDKDHFWNSLCQYYQDLQLSGHFVPKEIREIRYISKSGHPRIVQERL